MIDVVVARCSSSFGIWLARMELGTATSFTGVDMGCGLQA